MNLKIEIGFVVGFIISLFCTSGALVYGKKEDVNVEKKVSEHDYIFNTIPSQTYRTCLRNHLFSAYFDLAVCETENKNFNKKLSDLNDELRITTNRVIVLQDEKFVLQDEKDHLKERIKYLESSLNTTSPVLMQKSSETTSFKPGTTITKELRKFFEIENIQDPTSREIMLAQRLIYRMDEERERNEELNRELGRVEARKDHNDILLKKLLATGQVQSRLNLMKNLCNDARKGQTVEETWLNILNESKSPHSMLLRYRIKSCGLTYKIFAQYAQAFEHDMNFMRHSEYSKHHSKQEVEEVIETLQVEESLTSAVEVILIPFPRTTATDFDKTGPFATFDCVTFRKVPGGVSIDALKNAIFTLNDEEKQTIQTKFVTKDEKFTGEVKMCFRDHNTAFKFWFDSDPLIIKLSDQHMVRIGFRPILDSTKESLFPSPSSTK